jgi:hypothetical protein
MTSKAFFCVASLLAATSAWAAPTHTPVLDGRMTEYDTEDQRASYTGGGGAFGAANYLNDIYVTWDSDYLYVALAGGESDNKLALFLDVDPGNNTGATTTTNWTGNAASYISYNDVGWAALTNGFGLDFMVASEGFFNNVVQVLYDGVAAPDTNTVKALFDAGNGANPLGTPVDMAVYGDATTCNLNGFEARIPWSVLYGSNTGRYGVVNGGEVIPPGAVIRLFANLHNNNPGSAYSSNDAIPQQTLGAWSDGLLTSDTYLEISLDLDTDGFPDLEPGDVNAPWVRYSSGLGGATNVYVQLNEPVTQDSATTPSNWAVDGATPGSVVMLATNAVVLNLTNSLPAAGTLVSIQWIDVFDNAGNAREGAACLVPVASGLSNALTVRFYLETASGLGVSPGASNYFINGGSFPLEFGAIPSTVSPLAQDSGTIYFRDVIFPPGTPSTLNYKYSGQLNNTGTNNYEAVRLVNYDTAFRILTLDPGVTSMVITDYLGAAAGPWRTTSSNVHYSALYADAQRGAAGVRQQVQVTFALDLSQRDRTQLSRVIVQGSDPLRGFNVDGTLPVGVSDFAGGGAVGWNNGGVELYDNGTGGDTNSGDGIFMRTWLWSPDGTDASSLFVPDAPQSLVGGAFTNLPYAGSSWLDGRSPRSFKYKFYVVKNDLSPLESPASDLEYYLEDAAGTNIALSPFVWANEGLPPPPPSNSPTMGRPIILTNNQVRVVFSNLPSEVSGHGVLISTNLMNPGWMDFGLRAAGSSGNWTALVSNANPGSELYAAYAGAAKAGHGLWFTPNPLPSTGGTLRIWYRQHSRNLAGSRVIGLTGPWNGWGNGQPMTFDGDGAWYYDLNVGLADSTTVIFKARTTDGVWDSGPDIYAYKGVERVVWSPNSPTNGELFTITYDASSGPLVGATSMNAWVGYEEQFLAGANYPMTNTVGSTWETAFQVSTNYKLSVNMYFNGKTNGSPAEIWDNENTGRRNRAFITPRPYGVSP